MLLFIYHVQERGPQWHKATSQNAAWLKNYPAWSACYILDANGPQKIDKTEKACYIGILKEEKGIEIQTFINVFKEKIIRVQKIRIWKDKTGSTHIDTKSRVGRKPEKGQ